MRTHETLRSPVMGDGNESAGVLIVSDASNATHQTTILVSLQREAQRIQSNFIHAMILLLHIKSTLPISTHARA